MKNQLRKELIKKRKKLLKNVVLKKSNQIKKRLYDMNDFKHSSTILFYVSYDNEVFTHDMIKECLSIGKKVIVPISDKKNRRLILSKLNDWADLQPGSYGILEPIKKHILEVSIENIDLIIVPGVGFDIKGRRIGHGKGYYDNLLRDSKNALHIGFAFEFQIIDKVPVDIHDIPVDKIITEERIINCKK